MKSYFVRISLLVLGSAAAYAQYGSSVTAYVPFDFSAAGAVMPAGNYRVDLNNSAVMILHAVDSRSYASVLTRAADAVVPQEGAKLVFHRYGDRYFLAEVTSAGTYRRLVPVSRQERNLARRGADPESTPDRVVVAAR